MNEEHSPARDYYKRGHNVRNDGFSRCAGRQRIFLMMHFTKELYNFKLILCLSCRKPGCTKVQPGFAGVIPIDGGALRARDRARVPQR
jgi:hypothetical protein